VFYLPSQTRLSLRSKQTTLNRIRQTGSADDSQQHELESDIAQIASDLETHRQHSRKSHEYYKNVTSRCHKDWESICELESNVSRTAEESTKLENLHHNFTAVLSVDYQMQKLVPYWGFSPQPITYLWYCGPSPYLLYNLCF